MTSGRLPIGSYVRIDKPSLQAIVDRLGQLGYRTIGPQVVDGAVVYAELETVDQLPVGWIDHQDGGMYRLEHREDAGWFDYVVGPQSLKNYLFPSEQTVLEGRRVEGKWQLHVPEWSGEPLAVVGARPCEIKALAIQDRVFLKSPYVDPAYKARRKNLFVLGVNCCRAAATCFCHSMRAGPALDSGYDLGLTELDGCFVLEVGTKRGGDVATATDWTPCSLDQMRQAVACVRQLKESMRRRADEAVASDGSPRGRHLDTSELRELLLDNLEHPRWEEIAKRCLACANCTMVCPTCFCSSVDDVTDLLGEQVRRHRVWSSCFSAEHSQMSAGAVRQSPKARYRQWLVHKLATWWDQFESTGCVGCGRCITWCPVGIDLTQEVAAIRGEQT